MWVGPDIEDCTNHFLAYFQRYCPLDASIYAAQDSDEAWLAMRENLGKHCNIFGIWVPGGVCFLFRELYGAY